MKPHVRVRSTAIWIFLPGSYHNIFRKYLHLEKCFKLCCPPTVKGSNCSYYQYKSFLICACISRTFWQEFTLKYWDAAYTRNIALLTTEPATPVLYVVKLPVETASVGHCYLASDCTRANAQTYYRCIGIFWLHESSRYHRFPEVWRPWHHWQITVNAASDNQIAANAIGNIVPSHR
jgi:hypothetical protein